MQRFKKLNYYLLSIMAIINLDKIWNLFQNTKENKNNRILKGFQINEHLWKLWEMDCIKKNKKPLPEIESLIETYLGKELKIENQRVE